jgi:hypothetical protein
MVLTLRRSINIIDPDESRDEAEDFHDSTRPLKTEKDRRYFVHTRETSNFHD